MEGLEKKSNKNTQIFEENSCLFLENILIPKVRLGELVENGNLIKLSGLDQISVTSKDNSKSNYVFIVFYSISNDLKYSNDEINKRYTIWNITDLKGNKCRLYLFGEVFEQLQNETIGYLYLIINPSIITSDGRNCKSYLSISKLSQVVKVGKVNGFSICKGINKNGTICTNPIDSNHQGRLCKHHASSKSIENFKKKSNENQLIFSSALQNSNKPNHSGETENIKTESLKHISKDNKMQFKRLVKTNLNKIEYTKTNEELKRVKTVLDEDLSRKDEILDLNDKLNKAIKDNNNSEVLNILRYLSNFDTFSTSLDSIVKSGIIYSISNLELKTMEIETAMFALKIRHKLCNSKGYWPRIQIEKPDENENLKVPETQIDVNWKDVHKRISFYEGKILKEETEKTNLLCESLKGRKQNITKQNLNLSNILSKIDQVVSLKTSCDGTIQKLESGQLKKRLADLEEADKAAELKRNISSVKIHNAMKCKKCGIWTEGIANPICKEEHPESIVCNQIAIKESWLCKSCNERIYSINGYLNPYCPRCKVDTVCNLRKNSIYKLRAESPDLKKTLLIRNGERMDEIEHIDSV
ncbi:Mcm10p-like Mcm10p-like [Cryptosporidium sp. chipmunk genotype I]|uniref:Mcm10p-like Mcm10p-like n=1 Tax=Cryptosporidium sp. chipmunk genotype I TaxID=1280935 RepID=UPI00351A3E7C|nr:Mcm10p-like Mcm10p-like [Cryptosporidium sp. chipmunk genotype I]